MKAKQSKVFICVSMINTMQGKKLLSLLLVLGLLFTVLLAPVSALKKGESCTNDGECDGDLKCVDGVCEGGFEAFWETSMGGWEGFIQIIIVFILILGATMIGVSATFGKHTKSKWGTLIGLAISVGATYFIQKAGWLSWLFSFGLGAYAIAIIIIVAMTLLYFFLARMRTQRAASVKEGAAADKEEFTAKLEKKSRKVKKVARKMYRSGGKVDKQIDDLDKKLEKADVKLDATRVGDVASTTDGSGRTVWDFRGDVYDNNLNAAKESLDSAKSKANDVADKLEDLILWAKRLRKMTKNLKKLGLDEDEIDYAMKAGRLDYRAARELKTEFKSEVITGIESAITVIGHVYRSRQILVGTLTNAQSNYSDQRALIIRARTQLIKATRKNLEDYKELAKRLMKLSIRIGRLSTKGFEEFKEE